MESGPIILIEDDHDDRVVFEEVLGELGILNEVLCFDDCGKALNFLRETTTQPFIIFSDVHMPGLNGIELKSRIDSDSELRKKSIPFIFISTTIEQDAVNKAYSDMTVQGFFRKKHSYGELKSTMKIITDYWKTCVHPNTI